MAGQPRAAAPRRAPCARGSPRPSLLDVGCGSGDVPVWIASQIGRPVRVVGAGPEAPASPGGARVAAWRRRRRARAAVRGRTLRRRDRLPLPASLRRRRRRFGPARAVPRGPPRAGRQRPAAGARAVRVRTRHVPAALPLAGQRRGRPALDPPRLHARRSWARPSRTRASRSRSRPRGRTACWPSRGRPHDARATSSWWAAGRPGRRSRSSCAGAGTTSCSSTRRAFRATRSAAKASRPKPGACWASWTPRRRCVRCVRIRCAGWRSSRPMEPASAGSTGAPTTSWASRCDATGSTTCCSSRRARSGVEVREATRATSIVLAPGGERGHGRERGRPGADPRPPGGGRGRPAQRGRAQPGAAARAPVAAEVRGARALARRGGPRASAARCT